MVVTTQSYKEGAVRPSSKIVGRLELMSYTLRTAKKLFASLASEVETSGSTLFEFIAEALWRMDIDNAAVIQRENFNSAEFFAKLFDHLQLRPAGYEESSAWRDAGWVMENLSPYVVVRLLAENTKTATRDVGWEFADVVEGGYVEREHIVSDLGRVRRFPVITEGSSDSKVIEHATNLLRPDVADFFYFADMEEGYPLTGTGNLHKFCQGLVSIGIENNVVVVYDNDALVWRSTRRLPGYAFQQI